MYDAYLVISFLKVNTDIKDETGNGKREVPEKT